MATSTEDQFVTERPDSPITSGVSLKSDSSMGTPINFTHDEPRFDTESESDRQDTSVSGVSLKSDRSMGTPFNFTHEEPTHLGTESSDSSITSGVSLKSDSSMVRPITFTHDEPSHVATESSDSSLTSGVSLKSDSSMVRPITFTHEEPSHVVTESSDSSITSGVSLKSDSSMVRPITFTNEESSHVATESSDSSITSGVSLKSDSSMVRPITFTNEEPSHVATESSDSSITSGVSLKSDSSMIQPMNFTHDEPSHLGTESSDSSITSGVSLKSDSSMVRPITFTHGEPSHVATESSDSSLTSGVSLKSDSSMVRPITFTHEEPRKGSVSSAASSASMGESINVEKDQPSSIQSQPQMESDDPLNFNKGNETNDQHTLPVLLRKRILEKYENDSKETSNTDLFEIKAAKNKKLKNFNEIFETSNEHNMRIVLTKGVDGIGKTLKTKKMMVYWAKRRSNRHIDLIVTWHFSDLNARRDKVESMEDLLNIFFIDIAQHTRPIYDRFKIAFVLYGLEKCELDLDFEKEEDLSDIKEQASIDVLLTSLIKGTLLPSAQLWIISQPSGVDKIPPQYIHRVTECRETSKRREQLVSNLRERYRREYAQAGDKTHPNQNNLEHIIREDAAAEAEGENGKTQPRSVTRVNTMSDIFRDENKKNIRKVLTIKEPDIGESFHVEKLIEEWAKQNKASWWRKSKVEELLFVMNLCQLNWIKDKTLSMRELINHFFEETKESVISNYECFQVTFLLDGLDTCQLPLDFESDVLEDVTKRAPVDVLLTNLIQGKLLPSAKLWIISGPSSLKRLPDGMFDRTTEIREKPDVASQRKLKSQLKEKYTWVGEGIDQQKTSALLNNIYTPLYIITGERGEVNAQHETRQVQEAKFKPENEENIECHEIFPPACDENIPIKTALTLGVAGIGKSFASMKFILDWAEGVVNEHINFIFPLPFRELNLMKGGEYSFEELIHQFFPMMKTSEITNYDKYQILIVLDGLDECRCDLNFSESIHLADVREKSTVNVLLVNLIKGNLLPKAQIWITSRPAASNNIPADKVQRVTEVRGFNDDQKEEYFRKRFVKDFEGIFSHLKKSRSLFIMCHIPVFCWITAKVLEDFVQRHQEEELPKTLTDMYICFLLLQCRQANVKYEKETTDSCWNQRNKETILSLARLGFDEMKEGNFLFMQEDLPGHVEINSAIFSGLLTQVKRECSVLQKDFFCFVHLSIQEFLAALHVFYTFNNSGENLLMKQDPAAAASSASDFYKAAVDKALDSENGDWDLFLRFLLGLSQETNQDSLLGLLEMSQTNTETNKEIIDYIKGKIGEEIKDSDKNLNLFQCLIELNDHSLVKEVKKYLQSETLTFEKFSASQWSALTFVLLMSDEKLDVFDLKKYHASEKVLLGMLPVVKISKTALLSWCELSEESCKGLTSSVLCSSSSNLTKLDLSHNDLLDSGVELLAEGFRSLHCRLETVNLAGCQVTEKGCSAIASALNANNVSHLKRLDLSYNHPGDNGSKMLTDIKDDPKKELNTLCLDHGGSHRLKAGLKKYGVDLVFDKNTTNRRLSIHGKNVKTTNDVKERDYGALGQDKGKWTNVFCDSPEMLNKGLTGLCYWEVQWSGKVGIAVAYEKVGRKLDKSGGLGCNDMSWSLVCSKTGYAAKTGNETDHIQSELCHKIAVLLDWDGGRLSYYGVTPEKLSHIHTFRAKFTKPLFPGFWFKKGSLTLCNID